MKLAWKSRTQYLFEKNFLAFYIQPGQILVKRFFKMIFLAVLSEHTVQCPKTYFFMSFIYLNISNCKFLSFCSMDLFRFQKPLAISPLRIPRCQDFWDKSLGWFLGFQCIGVLPAEENQPKNWIYLDFSLLILYTEHCSALANLQKVWPFSQNQLERL